MSRAGGGVEDVTELSDNVEAMALEDPLERSLRVMRGRVARREREVAEAVSVCTELIAGAVPGTILWPSLPVLRALQEVYVARHDQLGKTPTCH